MRDITCVCGPPGAGKSTYVAEHHKTGDIVWDFDVVYRALTDAPLHARGGDRSAELVQSLYRALIRVLEAGLCVDSCIWIISSHPPKARMRYRVVSLNPGKEECLRRVAERGPEWKGIVEEWFSKENV